MAGDTPMTIHGNIAGDVDLRFTPSGAATCKFTVASTPRRFDRNTSTWVDGDPLFMRCTAWRQLAENIAESAAKGTRVIVSGSLKMERWESKEGEKKSALVLDVDDFGLSLKFATGKVQKMSRTSGSGTSLDSAAADGDPWSSSKPAAGPSRTSSFDDNPPF
jgi:single-strand DNA-binding protein